MTGNRNNSADLAANSLLAITAMIVVGLAGVEINGLLPLFAGTLTDLFNFSSDQVGLITSSELFGMLIATLFTSTKVGQWNRKTAVIIALVWVIIANMISLSISTHWLWMLVRFAAGIGEGVLLSVMTASIGNTRNPDRNFAIFLSANLMLAMIGFKLLPPLINMIGIGGILLPLTCLAALALAFIKWLPAYPPSLPPDFNNIDKVATHQASISNGFITMALLSIAAFYLGLGGVWVFMERIGTELHLPQEKIASMLAMSAGMGILGGVAASWLGVRFGRAKPILIGIMALFAICLCLRLMPTVEMFNLVTLLYMFIWVFTTPYLVGLMSVVEPTGKIVVLSIAAQSGGFAVGPTLAGWLTASTGEYIDVLLLGIVGCSISAVLIVPVLMKCSKPCATY